MQYIKRLPGIMRADELPLRLHTAHVASLLCISPSPDGLEDPLTSYSTPYNTSLSSEYGLQLSGSLGKQR
jgi:hypothetical protein